MTKPEKPKRLAPKPETLRELFLKSGNICAFPNCTHLMMNAGGVFVGQICHIEAAEEGGERFNPAMTNEQRRSFSNLLLMCYAHHQETNDVEKYTVQKLTQIKADHESLFASPESTMLETFVDQTDSNSPTIAKTLSRLEAVLGEQVGFYNAEEAAEELAAYVHKLRDTPLILRRFLGAVSRRIWKMKSTRVVNSTFSGESILISDLKGVLGSSVRSLHDRGVELSAYGLGDADEIDTDAGPKPAIKIHNLKSGWPLWLDLVEFCEQAQEPLETFTEKLDFARLDG